MASTSAKLRIAILHPDLGIGGAERLVVDAAIGLQSRGHYVQIFASHHDPSHCFEETINGTLNVRAVDSFIPRSLFGRFHSIFAILRQLYLTWWLIFLTRTPQSSLRFFGLQRLQPFDIFLVDQLSTCVPLIRWFLLRRVVFYCHFPDKLLSGGQVASPDGRLPSMSWIKQIYRFPINAQEEVTTGSADVILANSVFTARVFRRAFPFITQRPKIVYPGINLSAYEPSALEDNEDTAEIARIARVSPYFLSINRFEGKKNIALALRAFTVHRVQTGRTTRKTPLLRLMLAGGYDPRLEDNVNTLEELRTTCLQENLSYAIISPQTLELATPAPSVHPTNADVIFILNFTTAQRQHLLLSSQALLLLYTPTNEHFGIGPIEAMACGVPVLACASGGPMESIIDGDERTGWLRKPDEEEWADVIAEVVQMSKEERDKIADRAQRRVRVSFTMEAMSKQFERILVEAVGMGPLQHRMIDGIVAVPIAAGVAYLAGRYGYRLDIQFVLFSCTFLLVTAHLSRYD